MLNRIISFSVGNKLIIGLFTLALIIYGIFETTKLPIDAVPDITNNQVQVITTAPSLGATDIERLITFPIEQSFKSIPGIIEMRSFSRFGLSLITVVFEDHSDIYWARQQVSERLQQVVPEIPKGASVPFLAPVTTGLGEIYQYVVKPKPGYENRYSLTELRTIQDWTVRRELLGVKGVADVSTFGGKLKQYEVSVNPERLNSLGLSISDVFNALETNNQNTGGSYIEKGPTVLFIRTQGLIGNKDDIENIVVKNSSANTPILIRDIGTVGEASATRYGAVCYNTDGEVTGAVVMMLKGENSSAVIKRIKEKVELIKKILPEGVEIVPFLDRTKMVNNAISTVTRNLIEGALIVVLVLVFFLANLRAGLIVASLIPLSMLFAIIMMNIFKVGGNLMSLGAIDFGLIVDGAVIVVEAVIHGLYHNTKFAGITSLSQPQMDEEVKGSSSRIMNAAVFGQIIILIVYFPILTLQGIEGKMFKPMALTVSFAIVGAFLLSLTYVPMMSALFISKKLNHKRTLSDRFTEKLQQLYQNALDKALKIPRLIIGFVLLLFAVSVIIMSNIGGEFIPELEEGDFAVDTRVLTGSNLSTTIKTTQQTSKQLLDNFPEIERIVTKIGSGEIPTDPMPIEASDMMVILKDKSEWTSAKTFDELAEKMNAKIQNVPGVSAGFQFPVQMRFNELMTGARQDVVCKIFGENMDSLASYAAQLSEVVKTVQGSAEMYVEQVGGMPQITINYNRKMLSKYGLNINEVNQIVNASFAGAAAGQVSEGEKRFDLVVRVQSDQRQNLNDVQNLFITTPAGNQIPLNQIAEVREIDGPNQIQRENAHRRIIVGFNVRNRDVQSIVNELQQKVEKKIKLPSGYYIVYGGTFENLNAAKSRLAIVVPVALFMIFLMLYFTFRSVKYGLLIYSAIPLSAIGGIFALSLRGMPFSISAGVGFIALFGVAVLNGIVLISEFNRLKKEGVLLDEIVKKGTEIRFRSILMTALAPSLGFIPMAFSHGAGAEVQRPLATVVIGGIISATLLTLFMLPILYVYLENRTLKKLRKKEPLTAVVLLLTGLFTLGNLSAQNTVKNINLSEAVSIAQKNNLFLKASSQWVESQALMKKSWFETGKSNLSFEYGHVNSYYNDSRISFGQSFSFPAYYHYQKKMLQEQYNVSIENQKLQQLILESEINKAYYSLLVLNEKKKILLLSDSLYRIFSTKANERFKQGENNILEKATADLQSEQVNVQLQQTNVEYQTLIQRLNFLLNDSGHLYLPVEESAEFIYKDTSNLKQHPFYKQLEHQYFSEINRFKSSRSLLYPDIVVGANNMSIIGLQNINGTDIFFNKDRRFTSVYLGLSMPLFTGAQRNKNQAILKQAEQKKTETDYAIQQLNYQKSVYLLQAEQFDSILNYYRQNSLKNASLIIHSANRQFFNGEIDYLQFVMLINQSSQLKMEYLNTLQLSNDNLINLKYLTSF